MRVMEVEVGAKCTIWTCNEQYTLNVQGNWMDLGELEWELHF